MNFTIPAAAISPSTFQNDICECTLITKASRTICWSSGSGAILFRVRRGLSVHQAEDHEGDYEEQLGVRLTARTFSASKSSRFVVEHGGRQPVHDADRLRQDLQAEGHPSCRGCAHASLSLQLRYKHDRLCCGENGQSRSKLLFISGRKHRDSQTDEFVFLQMTLARLNHSLPEMWTQLNQANVDDFYMKQTFFLNFDRAKSSSRNRVPNDHGSNPRRGAPGKRQPTQEPDPIIGVTPGEPQMESKQKSPKK